MKIGFLFYFVIGFCLVTNAQKLQVNDDGILLDYYQNQRFDEALSYLKKNNPEPVTDTKVIGEMAYSAQMAGRYPEANDYYLKIFNSDSTNTALLYNLGNIGIQRGDNKKALFFYQKILKKDSTNFKVYNQLANISQAMGDRTNALKYFIKANYINPGNADAAYELGSIYLNTMAFKLADSISGIALKADTANLLLLFVKAQALYHLYKFPETVAACKQLLLAGDKNQLIVDMTGTSYFLLKQYNNCINTFKLLEADNTAGETSYYYMAMSYKAMNNQLLAISYLNKAVSAAVSPNVSSYYDEMADCYEHMHQAKNAINKYNKSLLYGPLPLTYYSLANIYDVSLKNKITALHYYKMYLKSNPPEKQKSYLLYSKKRITELQL